MPTINDSVQYLKGVGPAFAKNLKNSASSPSVTCFVLPPQIYRLHPALHRRVGPYDMDCCVRATVLQKEPPRRITGGRVMNSGAGR